MQLDESSWYYSWVLRKSRARDDIKDYMVKAHDSFNIMNLSVKVDNLFKSVASYLSFSLNRRVKNKR